MSYKPSPFATNLITTDDWIDLVTGATQTDLKTHVCLAPYEFIWLANSAG